MAFGIGDANKTEGNVTISSLTATYGSGLGVDDATIADEAAVTGVTVENGVATLSAEAKSIIVSDMSGRVIARGAGRTIALPEGYGAVILTADGSSVKLVY